MNRIHVTGNLGADARLKTTPGGNVVVELSVGDSAGRDKPTIWWRTSVWCKEAKDGEALAASLLKGTRVAVDGYVKQEEWTDQGGAQQRAMRLHADFWGVTVGPVRRASSEGPGGPSEPPIDAERVHTGRTWPPSPPRPTTPAQGSFAAMEERRPRPDPTPTRQPPSIEDEDVPF